MHFALRLSALALKQIVDGACSVVGVSEAGEAVVKFLAERFTDHSQRLGEALRQANESAWKALEIALAGESFWERCQALLSRRENQAFGRQVRAFLDAAPQAGFTDQPAAFRQRCLQDLRGARKAGMLTAGKIEPQHLARHAGAFARFSDPQALVEAEWLAIAEMADALRKAGYDHLGRFLAMRPPGGPPLLVIAVRNFFRRQVEDDSKLSQGLAYVRMERLASAQEQGFSALAAALAQQGQQLEELLADVQAVVVETHGAVLSLQEQMAGQSDQIRALGEAVMKLLEQHQLQRRELRPSDSLSIRTDAERTVVRQLAARFRALPEAEQQRLPALLNGLGKLEVVAGDFEAAQRDFQKAAATATDAGMQAEAHYHAYQAALQRRDWTGALKAFLAAVRLDARRLAPFPLGKYQPQRILGAGGFGVAFLCQHKYMNAPVVLKALTGADLDQGVDQVFAEAMALRQMDHPAVIRIQDCGFADSGQKARPYLVMDYFEGATLEETAGREALSQEACCAVARQIAEGLQAAHARRILHRDVKPANVLVRRGTSGWQVKVIDFGLALNRSVLGDTKVSSKTLLGGSIAGTLEYASPEQLGRIADTPVGPASDVYGFGKTCCYALFQTPEPTLRHWQSIAPPLAELLGQCLEKRPDRRPANFGAVLATLAAFQADEPPVAILMDEYGKGGGARPAAAAARRSKEEQERRLREAEARAEADSRRKEEERQLREAAARAETERRRLEEQERRLREVTEKAEAERRRLEEQQRRRDQPVVVEPIIEVLPEPRRPPPPPPRWDPARGAVGTLDVLCPYCRNTITVPAQWRGLRTTCPLCHRQFTVPSPGRKPTSVKSCLGCLVLLGIGVFIYMLSTGALPEVGKTIQGWFGSARPTTPGAVLVSDSFNRADGSYLGQPDLSLGGSGKYSYIVRDSGAIGTHQFSISNGTLQYNGNVSAGVEIATPEGRAENLGRDLIVSANVFVPKDASGHITEAGPFLRDEADAASGTTVKAGVSGYWVALLSTGEVRVKNLYTGAIMAVSGQPASFDSTVFHFLDARAHGDYLQVSLDEQLLTFQQDGQFTTTVTIRDLADPRYGAAGLYFGTEDNPGLATGQRAQNLTIAVYQALASMPVQNNFDGKKDDKN